MVVTLGKSLPDAVSWASCHLGTPSRAAVIIVNNNYNSESFHLLSTMCYYAMGF